VAREPVEALTVARGAELPMRYGPLQPSTFRPGCAAAFGAVVLVLGLAPAVGAAEPEAPRTISVTGQGEVSVPPDLAIVSFAVETTAPKASAAAEANARTSTAVAAAVRTRLEERDEVRTTHYSLDPFYEPRERGSTEAPRISGYVARNQVQVETRKTEALGALIDAAIEAGANRVDGIQFTLKDRSAAERDALRRAGAEARLQAESVAAALGVRLKRVVGATTQSPPIFQPRYAMAVEARAGTPVEAGNVTVSATLQVTYEIE
jgi:hypothetical protein